VAGSLTFVTTAPSPDVPDTPELRKARGAFFTPADLCRYAVGWAVRDAGDAVLEPSCGEAAFLTAAAERLTALGGGGTELHGVELHAASAREARRLVAATGHRARVRVADFLALEPAPVYDAVVGNPPYVRYQDFSGEARARGREAALRAGVNLTRLASSWAAFTVHAALFLRPGGRLALVLPAELLSVNYAAEVRSFLMRRFGRVRLVLFTERVFPGVLEEVVLLLAEGAGGTDHCELLQVHDVAELATGPGAVSTWSPRPGDAKWTSALLSEQALAVYSGALAGAGTATLHAWGETTLGAVTGNNGYFTLSPREAEARGLRPGVDLEPLSPPGSRHLRRLGLTGRDWEQLGSLGRATLLFRPPGDPSAAARAYIAEGERLGVPAAYKCRVRTPWWRVPVVPPADLLLTYMNADTPRLSANSARVRHLNSVHGVYLRPGLGDLGRTLPVAALNSLTLLGAEVVGRAYGGGMLKLEPREADRLPVPAPSLVRALRPRLSAIRGDVDAALAAGRLLDAVRRVDDVVLVAGLGLSGADVAALAGAREALAGRRSARSGGRRGRAG
jgi:adenine-specific DNA-methyltransferase